MKVKVQAPAKINMSLDVLRRRPDGYHDVSMVMQAVGLYDYVTVETTDSKDIEIRCDYEGVPCDERNIAYKAAAAFFKYTETENRGIIITIEKHIPTQAGLAGGSADGAAVIVALNKLFSTHLKEKEMCEIGERVGADVPFCIIGGTRLASGTGTKLKKMISIPRCKIVICKPEVSVSTAEAYSKIDSANLTHPEFTAEMVKAIYARDIWMVTSCMLNDFEIALDLEEIKDVKRVMLKNKALGACMSGSGSAVFAVFNSEKKAGKCLQALKKDYKEVFLCEPVKEGCAVIE
ncbi:MAG: 4-(cytidine 5'-diphospho)-2-C-methyl-D-erythritol kinase [Ruminococcus sp.]|nr:4-(cytidine 5'-diphospho)-2-C-methyl-D-erythritol kinase [Ruminococcus sp.]